MGLWKRLFGKRKPIEPPQNMRQLPERHDPHVHTGIEMRAHGGRLVYFRRTGSYRDDL